MPTRFGMRPARERAGRKSLAGVDIGPRVGWRNGSLAGALIAGPGRPGWSPNGQRDHPTATVAPGPTWADLAPRSSIPRGQQRLRAAGARTVRVQTLGTPIAT